MQRSEVLHHPHPMKAGARRQELQDHSCSQPGPIRGTIETWRTHKLIIFHVFGFLLTDAYK